MTITYTNVQESDPKFKMKLYTLTNSNGSSNMNALAGKTEPLLCEEWALVNDTDFKTGEVVQKLFLKVDGQSYGTVSPSFIRTFIDFAETISSGEMENFGKLKFSFNVIERVTKAGRTCLLFVAHDIEEEV